MVGSSRKDPRRARSIRTQGPEREAEVLSDPVFHVDVLEGIFRFGLFDVAPFAKGLEVRAQRCCGAEVEGLQDFAGEEAAASSSGQDLKGPALREGQNRVEDVGELRAEGFENEIQGSIDRADIDLPGLVLILPELPAEVLYIEGNVVDRRDDPLCRASVDRKAAPFEFPQDEADEIRGIDLPEIEDVPEPVKGRGLLFNHVPHDRRCRSREEIGHPVLVLDDRPHGLLDRDPVVPPDVLEFIDGDDHLLVPFLREALKTLQEVCKDQRELFFPADHVDGP